jgi:hypothetical protein
MIWLGHLNVETCYKEQATYLSSRRKYLRYFFIIYGISRTPKGQQKREKPFAMSTDGKFCPTFLL